jgi:ariadne-1
MSQYADYEIDPDYYVDNDYDDYNSSSDLALTKMTSYLILKEDQLFHERDQIIKQAMEFCSLEKDDTTLVLIYFSWSLDKLRDNWYDNVELHSIKSGIEVSEGEKKLLLQKGIGVNNTDCLICYSPIDDYSSGLKCKHYFCSDCWREYLSVKAEDVLVSLSTLCPQKGCSLIVPESYFHNYIQNKIIKEKFNKSILRNFTGHNSDIKICPGISCNICIKCDTHIAKEITCPCGTVSCFKCGREAHRPCTCEILSLWEVKSKSDSDNDKWIQANTKTCPHCKQKIEKSQGCNYMNCNKQAGGCGKAFCYVCEVDWEKHSQDHFKCNMYTPEIQEKENEATRLKAELARYKFYFDRFMNYTNAVKFAEKLRPKLENLIDSMINVKSLPLSELEFIKETLNTVIYSKRTLKYTYIFGFYLKDGNEKKLFEYSQSFLERNADNLHQMIEQDTLLKIISEENYDAFTKKFLDFKNTIVNLGYATMKYQKNLLNEIETTMMHLLDEGLLNSK